MLARELNFFEKLYLRMLMPNLRLYKMKSRLEKIITNSAIYKLVKGLRKNEI